MKRLKVPPPEPPKLMSGEVRVRVDYMLRALAKGHRESRIQAMKRLKVPPPEPPKLMSGEVRVDYEHHSQDAHASCFGCLKNMEKPDHVCECGAYICFCCFEKGACPDCGEALT